PDVDHVFLRF
uniref:SchistoFLRFamide n=2 Tax=Acrididae TaxID=7002 RepID=FARP_SCHGR|nr:RecName: Full=SchistoFLRFamide; AltName: Full=Cardioexcitatory neuropeptide; AltName: Full=PDVDHVFLRF-amide [Locusta migratoria]P84307.1 RecName: Full=SchistoFLRFamide; AltName: Full=Cardioexcitatory neuropeptide; AltName: Full=PDVDHVFLRF-amide [Schistocerca gregaria]prf//2018310A FMRFamide-related peptide [Locusta migratoria]